LKVIFIAGKYGFLCIEVEGRWVFTYYNIHPLFLNFAP
jgi:VCBS repeat-containing protein